MEYDIKTDRVCYIALCVIIAVCGLLYFLMRISNITLLDKIPPCMFHAMTGFDCPGCGGTRAVVALMQGRFLESFLYHPIVLYAAAVGGWFFLSQTVMRIAAGRLKIGMHFRDIYLWIALAVVVIHFLLKIVWRLVTLF